MKKYDWSDILLAYSWLFLQGFIFVSVAGEYIQDHSSRLWGFFTTLAMINFLLVFVNMIKIFNNKEEDEDNEKEIRS